MVVIRQNDELEDAGIAFRVASRLAPRHSQAWAGLAMVAQRQGQLKHAFNLYLKSLELDTDNLGALLGLFQTSCQMGSFAELIHYLELYLQTHTADVSVMFSLASLYMKEGQFIKCHQLLAQVVQLEPDNQDAANLLEELEHSLARQKQRYADACANGLQAVT